MTAVPGSLVQHLLLGPTNSGELQRFTQDAGIVTDVWLSFAQDLTQPQRVLLAPIDGVPAVQAAAVIHDALSIYRAARATEAAPPAPDALRDQITATRRATRRATSVAPLENYVAVKLYVDELIKLVLPLTDWWNSKDLDCIQESSAPHAQLRTSLTHYIEQRLGKARPSPVSDLLREPELTEQLRRLKVLEASYIAALIGLFAVAAANPDTFDAKTSDDAAKTWAQEHASELASAAVLELGRPASEVIRKALDRTPGAPKPLVQRVFLDRESRLADADAVSTIKADAADRVFEISCRSLTWAIIDSGVAAMHEAFDEYHPGVNGARLSPRRSRVKATFDLTRIDRIRNFDLTTSDEVERDMTILNIIEDLKRLPGTRARNFEVLADKNLRMIGEQLRQRLLPDWALIEPLIRIEADDGATLLSDHGTHVAGILAGDWRAAPISAPAGAPEEVVLRGVCPDISIYDLRVIHPTLRQTEFAVIAALEFVRYLNSRAAGPPIIHGVNISLSIPHEVRNYGCGVTPVCSACDDLVQSGVVVVAAAGNRGWNEREQGFGNFVFCSITDPGNAQQVITVGATHRLKPHTYGVSYFSSRGPTGDGRAKPDLVAPGEKIRGPIRGGADDELDGTSMSAPFVSGAAAMLMARNRELMRNPQRIKQILCDSATDLGREKYFQGHGLVDVLRALQSI